jgi:hypothetical protein
MVGGVGTSAILELVVYAALYLLEKAPFADRRHGTEDAWP